MQASAALLALLAFAPHANSISASRIEVSGGRLVLELELQTLSLLEVLPQFDLDLDLFLAAAELAAAGPAIADYVARHYVLRAGDADGPRLAGTLTKLEETMPDAALAFASQRVLATFEHPLAAPLTGLFVEVSLFEDTSPGHRDYATLAWEEEPEVEWLFHAEAPVLAFAPDPDRPAELRAAYAARGAKAALAFELAGFALALALASRGPRAALQAGALWSLAVVLALLTAGLFPHPPPVRLFALATALAVAYTGTESALGRIPRATAAEGALFGLAAGISLEPALRASLAGEPLEASARAAHALGLAAALLALTATSALLVRILRLGATAEHLAPVAPSPRPRLAGSRATRALVRLTSAALALFALYRFAQEAWFPK